MLDSEKEAKKLVSDPSSWSKRRIMKKAYNAMALTPDEEVPRHRKSRKNKKKHVHKWGEWTLIGKEKRYPFYGTLWFGKKKVPYTVYKWVRACKKCGYKDRAMSTTEKPTQNMRRWIW